MEEQTHNPVGACGCYPFPAPASGGACMGCSPNMILTCEEETVLKRMREIKDQVGPIAAKLKQIQGEMKVTAEGAATNETESEWHMLTGQLEELRNQWRDWQILLESAIEKKLILLGHREPR
jgi:hypothetical protein